MSKELPLSKEMNALGHVLGVPVKPIRTYFALLRVDRKKIEGLMSANDETRMEAVRALNSLETGHFEHHSISAWFIEDNAERLLEAYRNTGHEGVKQWILQLLGNAEFVNDDVVGIVSSGLGLDSELIQPVLYVIYRSPKHFQHLISEIKLLHDHPDCEVRWRCAMALKVLSLDYDKDIEVIQALMLDDHYATRTEAILAFQKILGRRVVDVENRAILERVIEKDGSGAAAYYAKELLLTRGHNKNV